ncbi:MAG: hypothetical protein BWX80_03293 [Candidatus Hydrogenedentes bacterium ADurb.Bin101]|nr:MAG: hypothetical protein BWX80_03293 [Candidatus Hydrogenedentes bacterium ADurb.Bin101]
MADIRKGFNAPRQIFRDGDVEEIVFRAEFMDAPIIFINHPVELVQPAAFRRRHVKGAFKEIPFCRDNGRTVRNRETGYGHQRPGFLSASLHFAETTENGPIQFRRKKSRIGINARKPHAGKQFRLRSGLIDVSGKTIFLQRFFRRRLYQPGSVIDDIVMEDHIRLKGKPVLHALLFSREGHAVNTAVYRLNAGGMKVRTQQAFKHLGIGQVVVGAFHGCRASYAYNTKDPVRLGNRDFLIAKTEAVRPEFGFPELSGIPVASVNIRPIPAQKRFKTGIRQKEREGKGFLRKTKDIELHQVGGTVTERNRIVPHRLFFFSCLANGIQGVGQFRRGQDSFQRISGGKAVTKGVKFPATIAGVNMGNDSIHITGKNEFFPFPCKTKTFRFP